MKHDVMFEVLAETSQRSGGHDRAYPHPKKRIQERSGTNSVHGTSLILFHGDGMWEHCLIIWIALSGTKA